MDTLKWTQWTPTVSIGHVHYVHWMDTMCPLFPLDINGHVSHFDDVQWTSIVSIQWTQCVHWMVTLCPLCPMDTVDKFHIPTALLPTMLLRVRDENSGFSRFTRNFWDEKSAGSKTRLDRDFHFYSFKNVLRSLLEF